jgi:thiamine kinase-like enzyme
MDNRPFGRIFSMFPNHDLSTVARHFQLGEDIHSIAPLGEGHINDSYLINSGSEFSFVLQRINHQVFNNPALLMSNIVQLTEHLASRLENKPLKENPGFETLRVIQTHDQQYYHRDPEGNYWRCYPYIKNSYTINYVDDPKDVYEASRAFGSFQLLVSDLPVSSFAETIPDFHHTPRRYQTFLEACRKDISGRSASCREEIRFARKHQPLASIIMAPLEKGLLKKSIVHNDTKINNVLLDKNTGKAKSVIDLDTVMPGQKLFDFGDMVRSMTCPAEEDEKDLKQVEVNLGLFESLVKGYVEATEEILTETEKLYLVHSGQVLCFEQGIRFLADYLAGDVYYKVTHERQNLDRARTQFKLLRSLVENERELQSIVTRLCPQRRTGFPV